MSLNKPQNDLRTLETTLNGSAFKNGIVRCRSQNRLCCPKQKLFIVYWDSTKKNDVVKGKKSQTTKSKTTSSCIFLQKYGSVLSQDKLKKKKKKKEWRNLKIAGDEAARNDYGSPLSGSVLVIHNFMFCPLPLEGHVFTKFRIAYVTNSLENLRCRGHLSNVVIW